MRETEKERKANEQVREQEREKIERERERVGNTSLMSTIASSGEERMLFSFIPPEVPPFCKSRDSKKDAPLEEEEELPVVAPRESESGEREEKEGK